MQKDWHSLKWEKAVEVLGSNAENGLQDAELGSRQEKFGKNRLPEEKRLSRFGVFVSQFKSPLVYILLIAGFITLILREYTDSIVIFSAIFLNVIVGFFQEDKASQALRKLKKLVRIEAQVIRNGNQIKIDSEELVPGDIIFLSPGNKVPADARLIKTHNLRINEAPLTGEWLASEKNPEILAAETPLADRDNMVYKGCQIVDGKGKAIVTGIGLNTQIGKIALLVRETKEEKTPLQKRIARFSKNVGLVIVLICILIFIEGILKQRPFIENFTLAVAVAVAAIPEGLAISFTVILALGMQRILKRKGLVRKLIAAETLGSTSVIATDKTLTLTEGKMEVFETLTPKARIKAKAKKEWKAIFARQADEDQLLLMKIASLCSEAFVENPQDPISLWRIQGRPTDKALILGAATIGLKKPELEKEFLKIDEIPFDEKNKFIAALHQEKKKNFLSVCGAPEKLLALSKLSKRKLKDWNEKLEDLTSQGLRVVAGAYKKFPNLHEYTTNDTNSISEISGKLVKIRDLTFVGLIALKDPLRKEAKAAISLCKKAGMRPIIVTGDHLLTAKAVAKELGFRVKDKNIILGQDLDKLSDQELARRLKDFSVFARVEPKHKMRIIEAWQEKGEVVAMTGDGINDAPALKKADVGVALGSGTDVAKEVSDLVLLTDNFQTMVAAVEEGRAILDNVRKVITYLLSDSFTETILIGVSFVFGLPLPIRASQILWVNLIEDGLPGIALAFEPKEKDLMKRKPKKAEAPLLTREMKAIIFIIGILTDLLLLALFLWLLKKGSDLQYVQTMIFASLSIDSLFYVFCCKSLRRNIWQLNLFSNRFLIFSWIVGMLALVAALYLPLFQTLLKTVALGFSDWLILIVIGLLEISLIETSKYYFIRRSR